MTEGTTPFPDKVTDCVLPATPAELSVTVTAPVKAPAAAGLKVTLIVQLPETATLVPQVLVSEKSLESVPVIAMLAMVRAAVPVLLRVTDWEALEVFTTWSGKVRLEEESTAVGAVPVPVKLTVWGLLLALSVMVSVPLSVPVVVGAKTTLMVQDEPAARVEVLAGQVFVCV